MVQEASRGSKNASGKGECCPGGHPLQLQQLLPESCLWFNQCHSKQLSPVLPSLTCKTLISFLLASRFSHTIVFVTEIARSRGWGGRWAHSYLWYAFCLLISLFQLPPVGAGGHPPPSHIPQCPSSQLFPAVPLLPVASLSHCLEKQQLARTGLRPVSQESPLGQVPFPYWPYYGSCIALVQPTDRWVASCPQSQALSGYSLRHQKWLILVLTGTQTQLEGGASHGLVVRQSLKEMWNRRLLMLPGENCNSGAFLWKRGDGVTII